VRRLRSLRPDMPIEKIDEPVVLLFILGTDPFEVVVGRISATTAASRSGNRACALRLRRARTSAALACRGGARPDAQAQTPFGTRVGRRRQRVRTPQQLWRRAAQISSTEPTPPMSRTAASTSSCGCGGGAAEPLQRTPDLRLKSTAWEIGRPPHVLI
jgi:hypothetical protein